jgi:hypothetical protein
METKGVGKLRKVYHLDPRRTVTGEEGLRLVQCRLRGLNNTLIIEKIQGKSRTDLIGTFAVVVIIYLPRSIDLNAHRLRSSGLR